MKKKAKSKPSAKVNRSAAKVRCSALVSRTTTPTKSRLARALRDARRAVGKMTHAERAELMEKGMAIIYMKWSPGKCG